MVHAKTILLFVSVFALLGLALGTALAPTVLTAELCGFTSDASTSRPCVQTVREATSGLLRYQGYGGAAGAVVGLGTGIFVVLRGRRKPAPAKDGGAPQAA